MMEVLAATIEPADDADHLISKRLHEEDQDADISEQVSKKPKMEEELLLPKNPPAEHVVDLDSSIEIEPRDIEHEEVPSDTEEPKVNELDEIPQSEEINEVTSDQSPPGSAQETDDEEDDDDNEFIEDNVEELQDNISEVADDHDFSESSESVQSDAESQDEQKSPRRPPAPVHIKICRRLIKKSVKMLNKLKVPKSDEISEILELKPTVLEEALKTEQATPQKELIQPIHQPTIPDPVEKSSKNVEIVIPDEDEEMDQTIKVEELPIIPTTITTIPATLDAIAIHEEPLIPTTPILQFTPVPSRKTSIESEPSEKIQPPTVPVSSKKVIVPYVTDIMSLTQPESPDDQLAVLLKELEETSVDQLHEKYMQGSNLVHFQSLLRECEAANKRWQDRCEKLWNDRISTSCKINELMKRAERKQTISGFAARMEHKRESPPPLQYPQYNPPPVANTASLQQELGQLGRRQQEQIEAFLQQYNGSGESASNTSQGQGRQGAIVDVQSLIADYRSKHPQDVPRRGRRMKNYAPNPEPSAAPQTQQSRNYNNNFVMKNHNAMSLYPVNSSSNNYYGGNGATTSQAGGSSAPTTSLLHGILTKSTPPTTSFSPTLARLLTAPERVISNMRNNSGKVHNNGEITITPISVGSGSRTDFSMGNVMDEDDNSIDRLVIDEGDDEEDMMMNHLKSNKGQLDEELLCQGCHRNSAKFLCAGCSKQWYCNRKCQIAAWDQHSEHCSG